MSALLFNTKESIQNLAQRLEKISLDVIDTQEPSLISHWFRSGEDLDLHFIVRGESEIVKQQICLFGQVVEWNAYEGVKTGFVQEVESVQNPPQVQETIRYDNEINKVSLEQSIEVLKNSETIDQKWQRLMLTNLIGKSTLMPTEMNLWQKLVYLFKKNKK